MSRRNGDIIASDFFSKPTRSNPITYCLGGNAAKCLTDYALEIGFLLKYLYDQDLVFGNGLFRKLLILSHLVERK